MYLDPGFGGMLIQIVVAIIAVSGAILFSLRKKIRAMFYSKGKVDTGANQIAQNTDVIDDDVIDTLSEDK